MHPPGPAAPAGQYLNHPYLNKIITLRGKQKRFFSTMSNFNFLHPDWPEFIEDAKAVEKLVHFDPRSACARARHLIEHMVLWMYENDEDLEIPIDTSLYNITNEISFKKIVPKQELANIHGIGKAETIALQEEQKL